MNGHGLTAIVGLVGSLMGYVIADAREATSDLRSCQARRNTCIEKLLTCDTAKGAEYLKARKPE